jgi:hypothetical protein
MNSKIEPRPPVKTDNNANQTHYYVSLVIAIAIGLAGVFVRFIQDSFLFTSIANILLIIASVFAIRIVLQILK